MTPKERLMACYQHACILFEKDEEMNNQSLRERFELEKNKSSVASRIIAEAVETGLLKSAHEDNEAKKFAIYIPYYG